MTRDPVPLNNGVIQTEECTELNTTDRIQETNTGEVHHRAPDTHLQLRMVNHKQDTHTAQPARLLILALGRSS